MCLAFTVFINASLLFSTSSAEACSPPGPVDPYCEAPQLWSFLYSEPLPANTQWLTLGAFYDPDLDLHEEGDFELPPNKETDLTNFLVKDQSGTEIATTVTMTDERSVRIEFVNALEANQNYTIEHPYECEGAEPEVLSFSTKEEEPLPTVNELVIVSQHSQLEIWNGELIPGSCDLGLEEKRFISSSVGVSGLSEHSWEAFARVKFSVDDGENEISQSSRFEHLCDKDSNDKPLPDDSRTYNISAELSFYGSSEVLRLNPTQIEINCADFGGANETELPGGNADNESGGCSSMQGSSLFSVFLLSILGIAFRRKKTF